MLFNKSNKYPKLSDKDRFTEREEEIDFMNQVVASF